MLFRSPAEPQCANAIAIALRPEEIRFAHSDAVVSGVVAEVFFQGDHALAQVRVGERTFLVAVREGRLPVRGDEVGLRWAPSASIPLFAE